MEIQVKICDKCSNKSTKLNYVKEGEEDTYLCDFCYKKYQEKQNKS